MDLLLLSFACAWVIRHLVESKSDDHQAAQRVKPGRATTGGWAAWQLRHGWGATARDARDGFGYARPAHATWRDQQPVDQHAGWRAAWAAGWAACAEDAERRRASVPPQPEPEPTEKRRQNEPNDPPNAGPTPQPADSAEPDQPDQPATEPVRITVTRITDPKEPNMSGTNLPALNGEGGGYQGALRLSDAYQKGLANLTGPLEQYEASLIVGGLAGDPKVMQTLAAAKEALQQAAAMFAAHKAALLSHHMGAEYAAGKGNAAANTDWLKSGA